MSGLFIAWLAWFTALVELSRAGAILKGPTMAKPASLKQPTNPLRGKVLPAPNTRPPSRDIRTNVIRDHDINGHLPHPYNNIRHPHFQESPPISSSRSPASSSISQKTPIQHFASADQANADAKTAMIEVRKHLTTSRAPTTIARLHRAMARNATTTKTLAEVAASAEHQLATSHSQKAKMHIAEGIATDPKFMEKQQDMLGRWNDVYFHEVQEQKHLDRKSKLLSEALESHADYQNHATKAYGLEFRVHASRANARAELGEYAQKRFEADRHLKRGYGSLMREQNKREMPVSLNYVDPAQRPTKEGLADGTPKAKYSTSYFPSIDED